MREARTVRHRRDRRDSRRQAAALLVVLGFGTAACSLGSSSHHNSTPTTATTTPHKAPKVPANANATVQDYVGNWTNKDWRAMAQDVQSPPKTFAAQNAAVYKDLGATSLHVTAGPASTSGDKAQAQIFQRVGLGKYHTHIVLHSAMNLAKVKGRWLVQWNPALLDRKMNPGEHFEIVSASARRAGITGQGGQSLISDIPRVIVGVVGERVKNPNTVRKLLVANGATNAAAEKALRLAKANPSLFEPVFDITQAEFNHKIEGKALYKVPGTQFESSPQFATASSGLGPYLVGGLGPITAQQLRQLGPGYSVGDTVGQGGLEEEYQKQLAGKPGIKILLADKRGNENTVVGEINPKKGTPVQTTIDVPIQKAAEAAIAHETVPSALVAIQASTGKVLAIANHDPSAAKDGYLNYALDATESPGSTFKTITSTALIQDKGLTLSSPATCPAARTVYGEVFHNDGGESFGNMTLLTAFAKSCNTAFIGLATSNLSGKQLVAAAKSYRIGDPVEMGYPAYGGVVPMPKDEADLASTSFGQGQISVSPLDMAMVAADIDSGTVRAPRLVIGAADDKVPTHPVNRTVDADLKQMMAAVVSEGTAAGTGLPSGTYAKTGTAQYGGGANQPTHGWLIGFRGDVAFAAFVNVGVSGAAVAAPAVAQFLKAIGSDDGA